MSSSTSAGPADIYGSPQIYVSHVLARRGPNMIPGKWQPDKDLSKWEKRDLGSVLPWTGFTFEHFTKRYHQKLCTPMEMPYEHPNYGKLEVPHVKHLKMGVDLVFRKVKAAFKAVDRDSPNRELIFTQNTTKFGRSKPFSISMKGVDYMSTVCTVLVGIVCQDIVLNSAMLKEEDASNLVALQHLAHCASTAKTRYGILATDKEPIIVCFQEAIVGFPPGAKWFSVPWERSGTNELTACMAVWCLINLWNEKSPDLD